MEKITKRFLNRKYDELYARATELLKQNGHCNIRQAITDSCKVICNHYTEANNTCCCRGFGTIPTCKHLGKNGCRVKSLRCKLWLCESAVPNIYNILPISTYGPCNGFDIHGKLWKSIFYVPSKEFQDIVIDMIRYRFHLKFREGKKKSVDAAYEALYLLVEKGKRSKNGSSSNIPST